MGIIVLESLHGITNLLTNTLQPKGPIQLLTKPAEYHGQYECDSEES